ncbi:transglycosylase SLT domain-containing protein [Microvirga sp. GCM10011540]|uniref:transglycosylase SLT domain-containing protein n=1 Tax=Microvirga sp. GCM10011540 TaxID=3317338 RepID=UPI0036088C66
MTWQNFSKTTVVAALSVAALAFATQAKAEGGDGPSIILPDQFEAMQQAAAAAAESAPSEEAAAETESAPAEKSSKKVAGKASQTVPGEEALVEQTSALAPVQARSSRAASSDAVRAAALKPLIARYASENNLPFELADAVVRLESRYNAGARNGPNLGLTQVNFRTAQSLGYKGSAAGLFDAETNLRYGLKYLAQAYQLAGGDTCGTILRYQFGHRTQTMTKASRVYCSKVKTIIAAAE